MHTTEVHPEIRATDRLAISSAVLGVLAGLLTTTLGFISLGAGAVALVLGAASIRGRGATTPAVLGMAAAATSIYVILLEIFVVGG